MGGSEAGGDVWEASVALTKIIARLTVVYSVGFIMSEECASRMKMEKEEREREREEQVILDRF